MDRSTKFKEAVKTGLAFALVYGIALKVNWINPYWAGYAVAMISLSTAGESIHKGVLRLAGTVPGCIGALVILSLAPQSRWLFLLLSSTWIFFTTYMMLVDTQRSYFWNVAGFVCLVILVTAPSTSENLFMHAVFRTVETAMGVVVYTLVTVLLWPRTNLGAIKKTGSALVTTQAEIFHGCSELMLSGNAESHLSTLHGQQIQLLGQFAKALQAEGSESYEVREMRHEWKRFQRLSTEIMENLNRWHIGIGDLSGIDLNKALPDLATYFEELNGRFIAIQKVLTGATALHEQSIVNLRFDPGTVEGILKFDLAALTITREELIQLEVLTRSLLDCSLNIMSKSGRTYTEKTAKAVDGRAKRFSLPTVDPDNVKGAAYVVVSYVIGFFIWIFFNPPGHTGWFEFVAIIAMVVAGMQQLKAVMLAKSIGLASVICFLGYVFIMPHLSTFLELGTLLFTATFVVCYFFTGLARLAGLIGVINELSVSNPQSYNFAAMVNGLLFTVLAILLVYALSYMLRSPRPEKATLRLVNRFFYSAGFLISRLGPAESNRLPSFITRLRIAFHQQELRTLSPKITVWSQAIDRANFPENTPEHVQGLVTSLQTLAYRIEELSEASEKGQGSALTRRLRSDIESWQKGVGEAFMKWAAAPDAVAVGGRPESLAQWVDSQEVRLEEIITQTDKSEFSCEDEQDFFRLLGGIRGVTAASIGYATSAATINWEQWREEMF